MQLTSQSSGPLQLEGVNGKPAAKTAGKNMPPQFGKKKKTMGQRMIAQAPVGNSGSSY